VQIQSFKPPISYPWSNSMYLAVHLRLHGESSVGSILHLRNEFWLYFFTSKQWTDMNQTAWVHSISWSVIITQTEQSHDVEVKLFVYKQGVWLWSIYLNNLTSTGFHTLIPLTREIFVDTWRRKSVGTPSHSIGMEPKGELESGCYPWQRAEENPGLISFIHIG
jgi:hypothetical protein